MVLRLTLTRFSHSTSHFCPNFSSPPAPHHLYGIFPACLNFQPFCLRVLSCCGCLFDFSYRLAASAFSAFLRPASSCLVSHCITLFLASASQPETLAFLRSSSLISSLGNGDTGISPNQVKHLNGNALIAAASSAMGRLILTGLELRRSRSATMQASPAY